MLVKNVYGIHNVIYLTKFVIKDYNLLFFCFKAITSFFFSFFFCTWDYTIFELKLLYLNGSVCQLLVPAVPSPMYRPITILIIL